MKATIPIGISPGTKLLRIERVHDPDRRNKFMSILEDKWLVWIHHNPDFTLGTYLTLYPDGKITNTTVHEDGTENTFQVKGPDK
jgi:hypothetical protein